MKKQIMTKKAGACFECVSHLPGDDGYPRATVGGKRDRVHRHAFRKFKGEIPSGMIVRHICDNRKCCNPDHLILGTHADNAHDRVERGRGAEGETNGRSKLKGGDVRRIREMSDEGYKTLTLAAMFDVSRETIRRVKNNRTWRGLNADV